MYSSCPQCNHQHQLSTEQLRATRGMLKCTECSILFDALESLSDQPNPERFITPDTAHFQTPSAKKPSRGAWLAGVTIGLLLLLGQIIYFEGYSLTQNSQLRPWLIKTCQELQCALPAYKNLAEISILQGSLQEVDQQHYRFTSVLVNQADFAQPYPAINLALQDFTGKVFAQRTFASQHFHRHEQMLDSNASAEISLEIAAPAQKIGGYHFTLI
jgi:predicted Zn finger-like uncharacterized protein